MAVRLSLTLLVLILCEVTASTAELTSGLQPGETAGAFHVQDVTGPQKGHSLCYACAFGKRTVINIQTRAMTENVIALIQQLDGMVDSAKDRAAESQHAFVVLLTEDPDAAEDTLAKVAGQAQLRNTPLTYYDELTGPPHYKLSSDAETTVMMWSNTKVQVNHAFAPGELDTEATKRVIVDAQKILSGN